MRYLTLSLLLIMLVACKSNSDSLPTSSSEELYPLKSYDEAPDSAIGLDVQIKTTVDLAKEVPNPDGRILRMRQFKLAPGGVVPLHSHVDRPAVYYIISGLYTEYRSDLDAPRILHPGDYSPEWGGYSHWVQNRSKTDTLIFTSADLFNENEGPTLSYETIRENYGLDPNK